MLTIKKESNKDNISFTSLLQEGTGLVTHLQMNSRRAVEVDCFREFLKQDGKNYLVTLSHDVFKSERKAPLLNRSQFKTESLPKQIESIEKTLSPEKLDDLIEQYNKDENYDVKTVAATLIHKMQDKERAVALIDKHIENLDVGTTRLVKNAVGNAGQFPDVDFAVSLVKKYLNHSDECVRMDAAESIGAISDGDKVEKLIDYVLSKKKIGTFVKERAIESIALHNDVKKRDYLIKKYSNLPTDEYDGALARIAGFLSDPKDAAALIRKLTSYGRDHYGSAATAVHSIKNINDEKVQKSLLYGLKRHGSSHVRNTVDDVERELAQADDSLKDYKLQIKLGDFVVNEKVISDTDNKNIFAELLKAYKLFVK